MIWVATDPNFVSGLSFGKVAGTGSGNSSVIGAEPGSENGATSDSRVCSEHASVHCPGTDADSNSIETSCINDLLLSGLDVLLLRKPGFTASQYEHLLQRIDPRYYARIMIAGQPALVKKYGLRGLHMSEAFRTVAVAEEYRDRGWKLSTSIHDVESWPPDQSSAFVEIRPAVSDSIWHHLILGPVFNSISKPGYRGRLEEMKNIPPNTLAIGGITQKNVAALRPMGFSGAVLLGAIWSDPLNAVPTYQSIKAAWNRT